MDHPGGVSPRLWPDLDFLAPPFCACCGVRFPFDAGEGTLCPSCIAAPPVYDRARAAMIYGGAGRDLILSFKHGDRTALVRTFIPWLLQAGDAFRAGACLIVPVPLHRWRLLKRRYNQAGLLAQGLARCWDLPYRPEILLRVRATPSQGHQGRRARADNVRGAFTVPLFWQDQVAGQRIVLVDDVLTTGATANACARALKQAGATGVDVLTLARVGVES